MGGKSSSKSSNSTSTTYNTEDGRLYVEQGGLGIGGKSDVEIHNTDGGAFDLTAQTLKKGAELVDKLSDRQTELSEQILGGSFALLKEATEDDAKEIAGTTIKGVLYATTALVGLFLVTRFWKK